jgi:uncharacterized membrane protein YkoI
MKKLRQRLLPITLLLAAMSPLAQTHSMPDKNLAGANMAEQAANFAERYDGISLDEATRRAEERYGARVVRTDVQDEDGRKVYVLKLLSDKGRVITVRVDAATGRMR